MLKVKNILQPYFTPYSSVSIINFEYIIADWESLILTPKW